MKPIPPLRIFVEDEGLLVVARGGDGLWRSLDEHSRASWTDAEVADAIPLIPDTQDHS